MVDIVPADSNTASMKAPSASPSRNENPKLEEAKEEQRDPAATADEEAREDVAASKNNNSEDKPSSTTTASSASIPMKIVNMKVGKSKASSSSSSTSATSKITAMKQQAMKVTAASSTSTKSKSAKADADREIKNKDLSPTAENARGRPVAGAAAAEAGEDADVNGINKKPPTSKMKQNKKSAAAAADEEEQEEKQTENKPAGEGQCDEDDELPNRGRDRIERAAAAKNEKRRTPTKEWEKCSLQEKVKDCLRRENFKDLVEVFKESNKKDKDDKYQVIDSYLTEYKDVFPESAARNAVFKDAEGEVDEYAEKKALKPGEVVKTEGMKKKTRTYMNLGIVSWRPYGKLSRQMKTEPGKSLAMLLCAALEVDCEARDGKKKVEDLFIGSSITLNKNGTSQMHVDDGNLGHSRVIGFGRYVGGETWVYDKNGTQWLNVKPNTLAGKSVVSTIYNRGWWAERDKKEPLTIRLADKQTPIKADRKFFNSDEGRRLMRKDCSIQLPFKRVPVYHQVADFMGPLPHATAPAFPGSFVDPAKRPKELQKINILGDMSPEEADFLLKWAADHQTGEDGFIRYVAVFYPHASSVSDRVGDVSAERAASYGFCRVFEPKFEKARKRLEEDYRAMITQDGFGVVSFEGADGKKKQFKGAKNSLKGDQVTVQETAVKERTMQVIRDKYKEDGEKEIAKIKFAKGNYKKGGSAETRDCPLVILDDLWRDWGIPELVEAERQAKIAKGKTVPGKEAYMGQEQKFLREILRTYAGRKLPDWAGGKVPLPYKDWPPDWFFLKGTDFSALKDAYLKHYSGECRITIQWSGKGPTPSIKGVKRTRDAPNVTDEYWTGNRLKEERMINEDLTDREDNETKRMNQLARDEKAKRAELKNKATETEELKEGEGRSSGVQQPDQDDFGDSKDVENETAAASTESLSTKMKKAMKAAAGGAGGASNPAGASTARTAASSKSSKMKAAGKKKETGAAAAASTSTASAGNKEDSKDRKSLIEKSSPMKEKEGGSSQPGASGKKDNKEKEKRSPNANAMSTSPETKKRKTDAS
ncbi:unnamed protein product [Amoebophrya sp. A120]|nr:unnamed protein product [Amoebophrya sp. A120]|eukprot:GSA120T00000584001.1